MKGLCDKRLKLLGWIVAAAVVVMVSAETLYAAGEQLPRGAILSGGSTHSANGLVMRDVIGQSVSGSYIAQNGVGLCSGFGCDVRANTKPDEPEQPPLKLFMPKLSRQVQN